MGKKKNNVGKLIIAAFMIMTLGMLALNLDVNYKIKADVDENYGYESMVHFFKDKCESEGLAFQYMTQGGQIRCENAVQGKFYNINYVLEYSYDISGGNITWRDANNTVLETRRIE
jgi:hypothetical protein